MAYQIDSASAIAALNAHTATLDATGTGNWGYVFDGSKPLRCSLPDVGSILWVLSLADPAANPAALHSSGTYVRATLPNIQDAQSGALTGGTAQYFRLYDQAGTCRGQGDVGLAGSGAEMILDLITVAAGEDFLMQSAELRLAL